MKLVKIALTFSLIIGCISITSAQTSGKKKIVVSKKVTEANGEVVTKKIILEGEEAEQYIKENHKEIELENGMLQIEKEIQVNEAGAGSEENEIIIKVREKGGEEKVIKWTGDGEIPSEIQEKLDENNITIDVEETKGGEVRVVVNSSEEKTLLGIIPENHIDGIKILDVIKGSSADQAGLKEGDVIYEVGGKTVGSSVQLKAQLEKTGNGGKTAIVFLRNGEKKTLEVKL